MFQAELIGLLNKFKTTQTDYEKNLIRNSIKNLCLQNREEFENFSQRESVSPEIEELFKTIRMSLSTNVALDEENQIKSESDSDLEKIKNAFLEWKNFFIQNNRVAESNCERIVVELIMFYAQNRFEVLQKVLKIHDDSDFESFKNMLRNYLRKFFGEKIEKVYQDLEKDESVGFFKKQGLKKKILIVLREIAKYEFNEVKIKEVLNEE